MIGQLNAVLEESYNAQFDLMDTGANMAKSLIAKALATSMEKNMQKEKPLTQDYIKGWSISNRSLLHQSWNVYLMQLCRKSTCNCSDVNVNMKSA